MSAQYSSEYSNTPVNKASCAYNTLGKYRGANSTMPPIKAGVTSGVYLTPNYSAIGYDALTHGNRSGCDQYFSITNAYGKQAGNCHTTYTRRLCQ